MARNNEEKDIIDLKPIKITRPQQDKESSRVASVALLTLASCLMVWLGTGLLSMGQQILGGIAVLVPIGVMTVHSLYYLVKG